MMRWDDLFAELDRWPAGGATFWWRDDDATIRTDRLARLLQLSDLPLSVAVMPALMRVSLAEQIDEPRIDVLQHGFAHTNHEQLPRKAELGSARPIAAVQEELLRGWQRLSVLFGRKALPVLVPPWNRIDASLVPALAGLGYVGLSVDKPRERADDGLVRANVHIDIIDWSVRPRRFLGEAPCLEAAVTHLAQRRSGEVDGEEPTGILTHHLVMDDAAYAFSGEFLRRTAAHPAAKWLAAREIFPAGKG